MAISLTETWGAGGIAHPTTQGLRLSRSDQLANYVEFTVSTSGDLTIAPLGGDMSITGTLTTSARIGVGASPATTHAINIYSPTFGNALLSAQGVTHNATLSHRSDEAGMTFASTTSDFTLSIFRNEISGASSVGRLEFEHLTSTGASWAPFLMTCNALDATNGSMDSELIVSMYIAGAASYPMHLQPSPTINARFYNPLATYPNNWESLDIKWDASVCAVSTNKTGSGTMREFRFGSNELWGVLAAGNLYPVGTTNTIDLGQTTKLIRTGYFGTRLVLGNATSEAGFLHVRNSAGSTLQIVEENSGLAIKIVGESSADHTAPAANGCTIYTKDNGAGKTQLMAIFATGAAQQIAIQP